MDARRLLRRLALRAVPLVALAGAAGCGESASTVTGTVTFQDRPLAAGSVILYCEDQRIAHGPIRPDGTYTITGVPRGPARATVRVPGRQRELWLQKGRMPQVVNGPVAPAHGQPDKPPSAPAIPDRYAVPEESGLAVTVDRDVTTFDIRLSR